MKDRAVICTDITKNYGEVEALKHIDLAVETGEIFGLIGPDGSGKTSLFRLIASLLIPDSGNITVFGADTVTDFREIRENLGYMPGRFSLYADLSVEENLKFYASVYNAGIQENYHLIEEVYKQIEPFRKRRAGKLSGGMKQKLALSCALIHSPRLLILDEPTTGVDAVSRREFWQMLGNLKKKGITILVSTPYMDEALMCDRIALFQKGQVLKVDSPAQIIAGMDVELYSITGTDRYKALSAVRESGLADQAYLSGQSITVKIDSDKVERLAATLEEGGLRDFIIEKSQADIEDCFINLMVQ